MRTKEQLEGSGNASSDMRSSRNFSEESFVGYKTTFNTMNAQNEHLTEKLKEAEKIIEIQKEMETKIMNEYRTNIEKIKGELREKVREGEQLAEEVENLRRRIKVIEHTESRMKSMDQHEGSDHSAKIYEL
jgi:predicted nuclease with TOPRIM domain